MAPVSRSLLGSSGLILIVLALVALEGTRPASAASRDEIPNPLSILGAGGGGMFSSMKPSQGIFRGMQPVVSRHDDPHPVGRRGGEGFLAETEPFITTVPSGGLQAGVLRHDSQVRRGDEQSEGDYFTWGQRNLQAAQQAFTGIKQDVGQYAARGFDMARGAIEAFSRNPCNVGPIKEEHLRSLLLPTASWIGSAVKNGKHAHRLRRKCNSSQLTDEMFNAYENWYFEMKGAEFGNSSARKAVRLLFSSAAKWGMRGPKWRKVACLPSYLRRALTFGKCGERSPYWAFVSKVEMCHPMKQVVCSKLLKAAAEFQPDATPRQSRRQSLSALNEDDEDEEEIWRRGADDV